MTEYAVIPSGWVAWTLEDPPVILGAGDTPAAAAEHAAERQRAGLAPEPDHAVIRSHVAADAIRQLLAERDAADTKRRT